MSKPCAKCGTQNRDEAKRCMECGQALVAGGTPVRYCAAGRHPMDPGWTECPYCATAAGAAQAAPQAAPARAKTVAEASVTPPAVAGAIEKQAPRPLAPVVAPDVPRRETVLIGALPVAAEAARETRRVVALLVTYSWDSAGQVFPIRTGRCFIGSDPHSDVHVASDPQMSGRHAVILFRGEEFMIDDEKSLNGTFVNDRPVDQKQPLANYSRIKTGGTVFMFVRVEPEEARSAGAAAGATTTPVVE
jgi:hypothetical protein